MIPVSNHQPSFQTERLELIAATEYLLLDLLRGEPHFARALNVSLSPKWTHSSRAVFEYIQSKLHTSPEQAGWWTYFPVFRPERVLIGSGGYKGPPDMAGRIEIGYEIAPAYRGKGLATEYAKALVQQAKGRPSVRTVQAHTRPVRNASASVLTKIGMQKIRTVEIGNNQAAWLWEIQV